MLILSSGCGLTMHQRMGVQQFSSATTEFASLTRSEFIQSRQDVIEMNRLRVLLGDASLEALDDPFSLETTQARLRALDALNQYGELLQTLLTTSSAAELQTSADGVVSSLNNVHGAQMNPSEAEAIGKAMSFAGGFLVEHKRARAMKRVVALAHPHVVKVIDLVERDFDPNHDYWSAGYRRTCLDLTTAIRNTPSLATNDLAGAQVVRASRLAVRENRLRFELVSTNIQEGVKHLRDAEERLHTGMTSAEMTTEDIQEYQAKVNEMRTLFEL
jgi:hypothetical protein